MGDDVPAAEEAEELSSDAGALVSMDTELTRDWQKSTEVSSTEPGPSWQEGRGGTTEVSGSNQEEHEGLLWHGLGFLPFSWIRMAHHVWNIVVA